MQDEKYYEQYDMINAFLSHEAIVLHVLTFIRVWSSSYHLRNDCFYIFNLVHIHFALSDIINAQCCICWLFEHLLHTEKLPTVHSMQNSTNTVLVCYPKHIRSHLHAS